MALFHITFKSSSLVLRPHHFLPTYSTVLFLVEVVRGWVNADTIVTIIFSNARGDTRELISKFPSKQDRWPSFTKTYLSRRSPGRFC